MQGMRSLLVARVVRPGYEFLHNYKAFALYDYVRAVTSPLLFERVAKAAAGLGMAGRQENQPMGALAKMLLHTGKDLNELDAEDFFQTRAWSMRALGRQLPGLQRPGS